MLLAAFDLIDEGKARPEHIPWNQDLRDRFTARFLLVQKHNDQNNPDLPFRYLAEMDFGKHMKKMAKRPLIEIRVADFNKVFARFQNGFEFLVAIPENRQIMRETLIARYFPHSLRDKLLSKKITEKTHTIRAAEDTAEYGRSPAFRRTILEDYDHQCADCGLRIRLGHGNDVSFIDAAHLIPFSESYNDHPTNGLALCKNHHWAMDRNIIAPGPDLHWYISRLIDPRRSTGEKDLYELAGKSVFIPKDPTFHPDQEGLEWRKKQLSA